MNYFDNPWRPKDFSAKRTEREKNYYAKEKEKTKCERRYTEWPDAELKNSPNFSKRCPKSNHSSLTRKVLFLPLAQKYTMHLGYFWQKPCHQELSKKCLIWSHWRRKRNEVFVTFSRMLKSESKLDVFYFAQRNVFRKQRNTKFLMSRQVPTYLSTYIHGLRMRTHFGQKCWLIFYHKVSVSC